MKLQIKVKVLVPGCMPKINKKGDWIDLYAAETISYPCGPVVEKHTGVLGDTEEIQLVPHYLRLGVAMQLPKGFEAVIASRSSTPKKLGLMIPSGIGIVDNSYCGRDDEWCFVYSCIRPTDIQKGDRVCQFRIQLSQHATFWQKIKWLFSSGVELVKVPDLKHINRGGFGSTGRK